MVSRNRKAKPQPQPPNSSDASPQPNTESPGTTDEKDKENLPKVAKKSLALAYICWALGGIAGLHHFYLGRLYQGLVWWTTGGGFYFGFVRDFWRLKHYVAEANFEVSFVRDIISQIRYNKKPEFSSARFIGMISVGMFYGYLAQFAVPENCFGLNLHEHKFVWLIVVPLAIGFGNYLVGNIGFHEVAFKWCWAGACIPSVLLPINPDITSYAGLFSTVISYWHRDFRRNLSKKKNTLSTYFMVIFVIILNGYLWYSMLYHNVSVTTVEGEKYYFRDLVKPYFEKKDAFEIFEMLRKDAFKVWQEMRSQVKSVHILEDTEAYKVLGLDWGASDDEITSRYRQLAKKYHPDKLRRAQRGENVLDAAKSLELEREYNQKMIEISQAYDVLISKKGRHARAAAAAGPQSEEGDSRIEL